MDHEAEREIVRRALQAADAGNHAGEVAVLKMAAASELLEALEHIAEPEMMRGEWVGDEIVYRWIGAQDFQDIARAAIAKADPRASSPSGEG